MKRLRMAKGLLKCQVPRCLLLIAGLMLGLSLYALREAMGPGGREAGGLLTIERVRTLSDLTTLTVRAADVQVAHLRGLTGAAHALLLVHGEVRVGVDLAQARFEQVDAAARRAVLVLPEPAVQSVRLDHRRTKLLCLREAGLWAVTPGGGEADAAVVNLAYRTAEQLLAASAGDPSYVEQARMQAHLVLGSLVEALGWQLQVRWEE